MRNVIVAMLSSIRVSSGILIFDDQFSIFATILELKTEVRQKTNSWH